jgi:Ca2+-transporting ATPase
MPTFDPRIAHQQPIDAIVAALATDGQRGQSEASARERREQYGANELTAETPVPAWRKFLAQFTDALVVLLLIATALSAALWLYERESPLPYEAIAILGVVLLNAILGYVQESRAQAAVAALRAMSAAEATVVRDDTRRRIPAIELVPGDLILIEEGDAIPADARLIRSSSLQTAEAALTGESLPTQKDVAPVAAEA